jgi:hypothetical protein
VVEPSWIAGDRTLTLAMPNKALSPSWGKSVGGVSERAGAKASREQSLGDKKKLLKKAPSRVVAAEGIPVFRKAARFAVRRWNEDLGRLVLVPPVSSAGTERAGDSGCPKERQGGERRRPTLTMRRNRAQATGHRCMRIGTRPSLGPSTRARQSSLHILGVKLGDGEALSEVSRLGKPG